MIRNRLKRKELYSKADYWDAKAEEHDATAASMWANNSLNAHYQREQISAIERILPDVAGKKVLEVGCGTGRMTRYFASRGADVTGFDFSSKAIELAEKQSQEQIAAANKAGKPIIPPKYEVKSVFDIDYPPEFDVIFSWGVITIACKSREELKVALARSTAAAKQTGKILFLEPVHRGPLHRVLDLATADFVSELKQLGFEIREVSGLHFWPCRLALAYFPFPGWLTTPLYHLGQAFLWAPFWGDYKLIYATRPNQPR